MTALSGAEEAQIEWTIQVQLRTWKAHPDYEDMAQEARIAAWRVLCRPELRARVALGNLLIRAVRWGAGEFLRSARGIGTAPRHHPERVTFYLEDLRQQARRPGLGADEFYRAEDCPVDEEPTEPDFSGPLIDRLELARCWAELLARQPALTRALLIGIYREGATAPVLAARFRITDRAVYRATGRALERYRLTHGIAAAPRWRRKEREMQDNDPPIRLKKFTISIDLSPETAKRLREELPAMWESWLELKRDLLQREADQITALLAAKPSADKEMP